MEIAEDYKVEGNEAFRRNDFSEAIRLYTKAIETAPQAIYYTNRALAYLKISDFDSVVSDCQFAAQMDKTNVKAHYYMAKGFMGKTQYHLAIEAFRKAVRLGQSSNVNFVSSIMEELAEAYRKATERAKNESSPSWSHIRNLVKESRALRLKLASTPEERRNVENFHDECLSDITVVLEVAGQMGPVPVPEYFRCCICFNIMSTPVVSPSGHSACRSCYESHITNVGAFDPITRAPMTASQLISNFALRDAIDGWLKDHPHSTTDEAEV